MVSPIKMHRHILRGAQKELVVLIEKRRNANVATIFFELYTEIIIVEAFAQNAV
jgi:hypothetical protein